MSRERMHRGAANDPKGADVVRGVTDAGEEQTATSAEELLKLSAEAPEATEATEATEGDAEPSAASPEGSVHETVHTVHEPVDESKPARAKRQIGWNRVVAYGVLPTIAVLLMLGAGYFKWLGTTSRYGAMPPSASDGHPTPALASVNAAKDSTIKILSYKPETADKDLNSARDLLTGEFRDSYTSLINDVVIPGGKQKQISALATVPAEGAVSADPKHAVVLLFVNQTVVVGKDAPTDTASTVRVTLENVGDRWLISGFDPV